MKKTTLGSRLLKLRTDAELTQQKLADKVGKTRQRILQLEDPANEDIRLPLARKMAKALGVPLSALVADVA